MLGLAPLHALLAMAVVSLPASLLVPATAEACSIASGIWRTTPTEGASLPSGSRIYAEGYVEPGTLTVTVDGEPAVIVRDDEFPNHAGAAILMIEPAAPEGATVTLHECADQDPELCSDPRLWSWTSTAPDVQAPLAVEEIEFGIYDHRDVNTSGDSCGDGRILDISLFINFQVAPDDASGAPRFARVEVLDAATEQPLASRMLPVDPGGGEAELQVSFAEGELSEPLREATCVQVTMLDLANNRSQPSSTCDPHHVIADPEQEPDGEVFPPDEPTWEDFEEVDAPIRQNCACRAGSAPTGSLLLLGLGLLGLRSRRR